MGNKRGLQVMILAVLLLVGCYIIGKSLFSNDGIPKSGQKAVEFSLPWMDGKTHQLSDYKGKVVLINF